MSQYIKPSLVLLLTTLFAACKPEPPPDIVFTGGEVKKLAPEAVSKTNALPVYMHYMPWFDAPMDGQGSWGIHWTMASANPENVDANGRREIASHYYPLIGPYDSQDPDVVDYHLLLMKYAGIDGVLINWYGEAGTNGDIDLLLENSNAIVDRTDETGMEFGVVLEDRFAGEIGHTRSNVQYLNTHYYTNPQYIHFDGRPLTLLFGPITWNSASDWTSILVASTADELLMPLWYRTGSTGADNTAGEYAWVYQNYLDGLRSFYQQSSTEAIVGGGAYPGFKDYYQQGGWDTEIGWELPVSASTMEATLDLAATHQSKLDFLQLITWNDFGEGTMIEPTVEFEFAFLEEIQTYTGVSYTLAELQLVYEWYTKKTDPDLAEDEDAQKKLEQAYYYLVALRVADARTLLDEVE